MRLAKNLGLIVGGVTLVSASMPPGRPRPVRVSPPTLYEWLSTAAQVSGGDVVGVAPPRFTAPLRSNVLHIGAIQPADKTICVQLERSSGLYIAKFKIANPNQGNQISVEIDSRHLLRMGALAGEIAIKAQASRGSDCPEDSALLPVSWGRDRPGQSLLVNSRGAARILAQLSDGSPLECRALASRSEFRNVTTRSFDTLCEIRTSKICPREAEVHIRRRTGRDSRIGSVQKIRLPC